MFNILKVAHWIITSFRPENVQWSHLERSKAEVGQEELEDVAEEQLGRMAEQAAREVKGAAAKTFAQKLEETSQQLGSFWTLGLALLVPECLGLEHLCKENL